MSRRPTGASRLSRPGIASAWPGWIAFRSAGLKLPLVGDLYNTFDEFLRQGALFYLSDGQTIDIVMPDGNRESF